MAPRRQAPSENASPKPKGAVLRDSWAEDLRNQIAEAAYYRALRRGMAPGREHEDWLEAETEIRRHSSKEPEREEGVPMADDLKQTGKADDERINVGQDHELTYWSEKLGVSREQLRKAVAKVGPMRKAVEQHLRG